jgi:hypothetical protein
MVALLWTGGVNRNRLQDFRARTLIFVSLLVQLSNETISAYRSNRLPLCNFFGQVFGQGCHLSVYRDICVTGFCCAPTGLLRCRRVVKNLEAAVNPEEPDFNLMRTKAPTLEEVSLRTEK